jgi:lysine 2,3-aminomutase
MKESGKLNDIYQSQQRSNELTEHARSYTDYLKNWPDASAIREQTEMRRKQIMEVLGGSEEDWSNWKWQLKNRINNPWILSRIFDLNDLEIKAIERVSRQYRWSISPYYLSLVGTDYKNSPIYRQAVPDIRELEPGVVWIL